MSQFSYSVLHDCSLCWEEILVLDKHIYYKWKTIFSSCTFRSQNISLRKPFCGNNEVEKKNYSIWCSNFVDEL